MHGVALDVDCLDDVVPGLDLNPSNTNHANGSLGERGRARRMRGLHWSTVSVDRVNSKLSQEETG
jgi:hypothetical protein